MKKTKWIALILTAALLCSMYGALTVSAAESGMCGDNLTWTLDDNGLLTISGTGDMYNTIQPWDRYNNKITAVQINNGVTSIGERAFYGCVALTSISIPDGVTSIGDMAFTWCEALTSITIPDGVTSIGDLAFYVCSALTSVTIPDGVTSIGVNAFGRCSALASIVIPESITSIESEAFFACDNLTIYGCRGSYAQEYANARGIPYCQRYERGRV